MSITSTNNFIRIQLRIKMWPIRKKIGNHWIMVEEAHDVWEFEFISR